VRLVANGRVQVDGRQARILTGPVRPGQSNLGGVT
jgi:hypothetical protein